MDTVTHLVAGALTPLAVKNAPKTRALTIFGIICGEFPDIDVLAGQSPEALLVFHRGITHSLLMQPVSAFILAALFHRLLKKGDVSGTWTFAKTWALALFILCTHLFLDCMTTFGTQIFLPFSNYRVALPAMFIIDLSLTLPLLAAWVCLLRRGGSFAPEKNRAPAARKAMAWLFAYPLLALCLNYTATQALEARYAAPGNELGITRVDLTPEPFAPLNWKVVGVSPHAYRMARFFVPKWGDELNFTEFERPDPAFVAELRQKLPLFAMFDDFTTYMWVRSVADKDNNILHLFRDVRYESTLPRLMAALGRTDGLFLMEVKTNGESGKIRAYRFLRRGKDASEIPWSIPENAAPGNAMRNVTENALEKRNAG